MSERAILLVAGSTTQEWRTVGWKASNRPAAVFGLIPPRYRAGNNASGLRLIELGEPFLLRRELGRDPIIGVFQRPADRAKASLGR